MHQLRPAELLASWLAVAVGVGVGVPASKWLPEAKLLLPG